MAYRHLLSEKLCYTVEWAPAISAESNFYDGAIDSQSVGKRV